MEADFTIEDGGDDELGAVADFVAVAGAFDVGFDGYGREVEDGGDVGVALALSGEDRAFALAGLQAGGADLA